MATHSSRGGCKTLIPPHKKERGKKRKNDRRRWWSASGFDLVAAQTGHVAAVVAIISRFTVFGTFLYFSQQQKIVF